AFVESHATAKRLEDTGGRAFYVLPSAPIDGYAYHGALTSLPIRSAAFNLGPFDVGVVTDGNPETVWATPKPQRGDEEIILELDGVHIVSGLSLATGSPMEGYPRELVVTTSVDGESWQASWSGGMAGAAVEGALRDPLMAEARIAFAP